MNVPLLDLNAQLTPLEQAIKGALAEVADSGQYILGPKVAALEDAIAEYCGTAHAVGVSSGSDALLASLMALEIGHGDHVVTTPYSFFATAGAIVRLGARPVFIDIDPDTYNIDPEALAAWFDENPDQRDRVKALLPVHLYGQCADLQPLLERAAAHNIPLIEDAAQAIGATYPAPDGTKTAGSMGRAGCFSFFPAKNLGGMGDGGMVTTSDDAFADRLRVLRNHGMTEKYHYDYVGGNFRLDALQAAVLLVKLPHLPAWQAQRQEHAQYYDVHLDVPGLKKPHLAYGRNHHVYNQYVVSVPERREELRAFLRDRGIGHEVYYPVPFHLQRCFADLGYQPGDFPNAEHAAAHTLALPIYPELTVPMQDAVIEALHAFYAR